MVRVDRFSSTYKLVLTAVLSGLAILLFYFELPVTFYNFLRIDLSDVVVLVALVFLGVKEGLYIAFVKSLIHFIFPGLNPTGGIGETAAFIASASYIVGYYFASNKLNLRVIPSLVVSIVFMTLVMTFLNWALFTPLYFTYYGDVWPNQFNWVFIWSILSVYVPFNLLKGVVIASVFYAIYKALNYLETN